MEATAIAGPNIAFVKYWGNRDDQLRLPANGSISLTLHPLQARAHVRFDPALPADQVIVQGVPAVTAAAQRTIAHLNLVREWAKCNLPAVVETRTNFPEGVGLASSAAVFAALTLAAAAAAGLQLDPRTISRLARRGSGSACRSVFGGYVEWYAGEDDTTSFAEPIAPPEYWYLVDLIAIVSAEPKAVGSTAGHALAATSPLQAARLADAPRRLAECRKAILTRDFERLAFIAEQDSNLMHAVMLTSTPTLLYWRPATISVMQAVLFARGQGIPVFYTIDAGPNVHCLCPAESADHVERILNEIPGVQRILRCHPGGPAQVI